MEFFDCFFGVIKQWEVVIYNAFLEEKVSSDIITQWQQLETDRKENHAGETCEICKMSMTDEKQIVKLLMNEIGCIPRYAEFDGIGTVKDYESTGYSFVAKKNKEVVGVIMAQKIMGYGSYHIFVENFAVESSLQGRGIGKQLMDCVIDVAKKNQIHENKLYTRKNFKDYDIYHHMGFEDQDDESVYLTKFFV